MKSIVNQIQTRIKKCGRGSIIFATDFADLAKRDAINKSLLRLHEQGLLIKYARGIYVYPKKSKWSESGFSMPSVDDVAKALAKRDKARIVPTGSYALNALGLSTQVVMNAVYLTDGASRKVSIGDGKGIVFKHTAPRNLAYSSDLMMLVVSALKEIGQERITEQEFEKIKKILTENESRDNILKDINLAPSWIGETILKMLEL